MSQENVVRKRKMYGAEWPRKPGGDPLPRPPPSGYRPPNGLIWGHGFDEFCWISRYTDIPVVTMWSRSMIKQFGENYTSELEEIFFNRPDIIAKPRLRKPWPVLKVPPTSALGFNADTGVIDEGSDHEDERSWEAVLYDSDDEADLTLRKGIREVKDITGVDNDLGHWSTRVVKKVKFKEYPDTTRTQYLVKYPSKVAAFNASSAETTQPAAVGDTSETSSSNDDSDTSHSNLSGDDDNSSVTSGDDDILLPGERSALTDKDYSASHLFSLEDIPALEEHIPPVYLPDSLIVHDPLDVCSGHLKPPHRKIVGKPSTYLYRRLYPAPKKAGSKDPDNPNIAHLYLSLGHRIGTGHHSLVYAAPLKLPTPLSTYRSSSRLPGTVQVVAKVALAKKEPRQLLNNEGRIYNGFPNHMSEEYCGWHLISPFMHSPAPSCPVVPKFYGYYVPVDLPGNIKGPEIGRSPILLIEDCGAPINASEMSVDERAECYSLLMRLHLAEYFHGSFHERNILKKPGPLTKPPSERSLDNPSFRVIDFGRTESFKTRLREELSSIQRYRDVDETEKKKIDNQSWVEFNGLLGNELRHTRGELGFDQIEAI
ncbi:hypothetical protein C8Q75DRAFT_807643 [Abortiporus biennis]|nr:hypothetical protein C8Q75DRAFT_807643 [Abortiporus biennis]